MSTHSSRVYVCHGPHCGLLVAPIWQALTVAVQQGGLAERCELIVSGCQGRCEVGPNINVYPNLTKYARVTAAAARRIAAEHLAEGQPVADLVFRDGA